MSRVLQPPLKWAGGKRWLAPIFRELFQEYLSLEWIEPFCGGLGLTLSILPERAILNDLNPHLINFYRWVSRGLRIPSDLLQNDGETYYRNRERFNSLIASGKSCSREAAALFYYLNRTGYNGLCRFNRSGEFNVPFGRYRRIEYRTSFGYLKGVFSQWEFTCGDFETLTPRVHEKCLVYADPPYDVEFVSYNGGGFSWEDQVRLARWLAGLPAALVVVSNQATERVLNLYQDCGFKLKIVSGPRRISCTGDRTPAQEVLAWRTL